MKVVNPIDTTHNTILIPRYYPTGAVVLELYNESSKVFTTVANTYNTVNGNLTITYNFTFEDNDKFQFTIKENEAIVYRGKLIATSQEPDEYKLTNGLYYYE